MGRMKRKTEIAIRDSVYSIFFFQFFTFLFYLFKFYITQSINEILL